ncbi:MAG: hypothetical protein PVJ67_06535 [Candidatus Pacearchaeota archaeon]|jgi:hypothetical protein
MIIEFKKMKLNGENMQVKILGESVSSNSHGEKVDISMSILQLAKVWGTDREVSDLENGFGSWELEKQCEETKKLINKFPEVKFWDKEVECYESKIGGKNGDNIEILGEDISGWNGEGISIEMPFEVYDKEINGKDFDIILTPFTIILRIKKDEVKKK